MSMLYQFQEFDNLIVEHTVPPVLTVLRNQLSLVREQVEAYQASSDEQDATLARQLQRITELEAENTTLVSEISKLKNTKPKSPFAIQNHNPRPANPQNLI